MSKTGIRITLLGAVLGLSGCGYFDSRTVHKAQMSMIGMTSNDLQACAGAPDKITKLNDTTQIYQYANKPSATGAFSVNPFGLSDIKYNGTGSACTVIFRVDHSQITEVHYTGDNDRMIGHEGLCEPVIRGCMRQPEPTMRKIDGGLLGPVSAFHSPAVPQQSQSAVWNEPPADLPALKTEDATAAAKAATSATTNATSSTGALINRGSTAAGQ